MVQLTQEDLQRIVVLEGPPFSGKTTLLNYISEKHGDRFITIKEMSEYMGGDIHGPKFPYESFNDAKAGLHFLIEIERSRWNDVKNALKQKDKIVLIDRLLPISTSAFLALIEKTNASWHNFSVNIYDYSVSLFNTAIKRDLFAFPLLYVLLYPKNQQIFTARISRGANNNFIKNWSNNHAMTEIYKKYFSGLLSNNQLCFIESDNCLSSLQDAVNKIEHMAKLERADWKCFSTKNIQRKPITKIDFEAESIRYSEEIGRARQCINHARVSYES